MPGRQYSSEQTRDKAFKGSARGILGDRCQLYSNDDCVFLCMRNCQKIVYINVDCKRIDTFIKDDYLHIHLI